MYLRASVAVAYRSQCDRRRTGDATVTLHRDFTQPSYRYFIFFFKSINPLSMADGNHFGACL